MTFCDFIFCRFPYSMQELHLSLRPNRQRSQNQSLGLPPRWWKLSQQRLKASRISSVLALVMSLSALIYVCDFLTIHVNTSICNSVSSGSSLKKEVNGCQAVSFDLPRANPLRVTLQEYKTKFEESLDEFLGH